MRQIPLGRGAVAIVDDADFPWLTSMGTWRLNSSGYAVHYVTHSGRRRTLYMHRLILKPTPGIQVDHINRNRLDNLRENLRFATRSQNQANKGLPINNTSDYKGKRRNTGKNSSSSPISRRQLKGIREQVHPGTRSTSIMKSPNRLI